MQKKKKKWGREDKTPNIASGSLKDFESTFLLEKVRQEAEGGSCPELAGVLGWFFELQSLFLTQQSQPVKSGVRNNSQFKRWDNLCGLMSFGGSLNLLSSTLSLK